MYFAITFTSIEDETKVRNTWDDWHLIPTSRPHVVPPEPKTNFVDVPGADGSLDYTEILSGIKFNNREGNWEFIVENGHQEWHVLYKDILSFLHGRRFKITLESDPDYYYFGRMSLESWESSSSDRYSKVNFKYVIEPYKYPNASTGSYDWLWDELQFVRIYEIYYGRFNVNGVKERNLINPRSVDITPAFTCADEMVVEFNDSTYTLPIGTTTDSGIILSPGDNNMSFHGHGDVIVDYSTGRVL